jgi:hypothetical protein
MSSCAAIGLYNASIIRNLKILLKLKYYAVLHFSENMIKIVCSW